MSIETIFMPLMNEGTDVWVTVRAERLANGNLRVLGPTASDQEWAFAPGDLVATELRRFADGSTGLAAVAIKG